MADSPRNGWRKGLMLWIVAVGVALTTIGAVPIHWQFIAYYALGGFVVPLVWLNSDRVQTLLLAGAAPVLIAALYPQGWVTTWAVVHLIAVAVSCLLPGQLLAHHIRPGLQQATGSKSVTVGGWRKH